MLTNGCFNELSLLIFQMHCRGRHNPYLKELTAQATLKIQQPIYPHNLFCQISKYYYLSTPTLCKRKNWYILRLTVSVHLPHQELQFSAVRSRHEGWSTHYVFCIRKCAVLGWLNTTGTLGHEMHLDWCFLIHVKFRDIFMRELCKLLPLHITLQWYMLSVTSKYTRHFSVWAVQKLKGKKHKQIYMYYTEKNCP